MWRQYAQVTDGFGATPGVSSLISLLKFVADPTNVLPAITFWLIGYLASVAARAVYLVGPPICAG
jgi:iron complex transport system permease protein